jgi:D-alanyl-D-alanine carboxypeptidase
MNVNFLQKKVAFKNRVILRVDTFNKKHKRLSFLGMLYAVCAITLYNLMLYLYVNTKRFTALACILLFFTLSSSFSYPAMTLNISFDSDLEAVEDNSEATAVLSQEEVAESEAELVADQTVDSQVLEEADEVVNPDAAEIDDMASVSEILSSDAVSLDDSFVPLSESASKEDISFSSKDWKLVLVNKQHPIPDDYEFTLGTISDNMKCDERVITPLLDMLKAARADGVNLIVCSPYRDLGRQTMLFSNKVDRYMDGGLSYMEAYNLASQAVTVPGSSEHQIGLAVDIITDGYTSLDEGFGDTAAGKWLSANSMRYGFILRYPKGKEHITSIEYEPWHFRYVGQDAATVITENGLCLEEFWNKFVD